MRRLLAALAIAIGFSLLSVPAAQASHPRAQIVVSPRNTYPGQLVLVSGSCLRTGALARIEIDRHHFATTVTRSRGHFSFVRRLPTTLQSRAHLMYLVCNGRVRALGGFRFWPRREPSDPPSVDVPDRRETSWRPGPPWPSVSSTSPPSPRVRRSPSGRPGRRLRRASPDAARAGCCSRRASPATWARCFSAWWSPDDCRRRWCAPSW